METVAEYFQHYINFIPLQAFFEENRKNLNIPEKLDKLLAVWYIL